MVGYTASLAHSRRSHGIRANGINPDWVDTDMARAYDLQGNPDWITEEQIAQAALYLTAHAPEVMTGQFIDIFGVCAYDRLDGVTTMSQSADFSETFYRDHARRYAAVSHNFIQSVYTDMSHPALTGDTALMDRLQELVPAGSRGLDAGCGAGARDVFFYWQKGYDIQGVDAVEENIQEARRLHPEIANRVSVTDLRQPLVHPDLSFDFILCNAVIQHIAPDTALGVTLPEFARLLKAGGVLQLMFKTGSGIATVYDRDYGADRTFQLYDPGEVLGLLIDRGLSVVPAEGDKLGGVMYFKDPKPMDHCVLFARKDG